MNKLIQLLKNQGFKSKTDPAWWDRTLPSGEILRVTIEETSSDDATMSVIRFDRNWVVLWSICDIEIMQVPSAILSNIIMVALVTK